MPPAVDAPEVPAVPMPAVEPPAVDPPADEPVPAELMPELDPAVEAVEPAPEVELPVAEPMPVLPALAVPVLPVVPEPVVPAAVSDEAEDGDEPEALDAVVAPPVLVVSALSEPLLHPTAKAAIAAKAQI